MSVDGAAGVVAGKDSLERCDTVVVSQLYTTEKGGIQAGLASGIDARVHARGVAIPDIDGDAGNGLAGVDVDVLHLKEHVDALAVLRLDHVGTEILASYVIRTVGDGGRQYTASVGVKNGLKRCEGIIVVDTSLVMVDGFPGLEILKVSAVLAGS